MERLIGSIRHECTDHIIPLNEDHLRRSLRSYFVYYHNAARIVRSVMIAHTRGHLKPRAKGVS